MKHILLIEDNPDIRKIYTTAFENAGYAVTQATDGQSGLNHALDGGYQAILVDLKMPTVDGLQFLDQVHQKPPLKPNGPIFVLSSVSYDYAKKEAIRRGAVAFLSKEQLEPGQVVQTVEDMLKQAHQQNQTSANPTPNT